MHPNDPNEPGDLNDPGVPSDPSSAPNSPAGPLSSTTPPTPPDRSNPYDLWPNAVRPNTSIHTRPIPSYGVGADLSRDLWPNAVPSDTSPVRAVLVAVLSGVLALVMVFVTLGLTQGEESGAARALIGEEDAPTRHLPEAQNESRLPPTDLAPTDPPPSESATPPQLASLQLFVWKKVDAILAGHTTALESGNQAGFLDRLDPAKPALATDRKRLFDNLRKIPFQTARWSVSDAKFTAADGSNMRNPDTAAAWPVTGSVDVQFEHAIQGVDVVPVREAYLWQVRCVDAADGCTITSVEGGKDTARRVSGYPAPWDLWDLVVEKRPHVLLMGPKADAGILRSRATAAENAAVYTLGAWKGGAGTSPGFVLVLTSSRKSFAKLYSTEDVRSWVAGYALSLPGEKIPAGGVRLVVDDEELSHDADFTRSLLRHEMAHALVTTLYRFSSNVDTPTWLVEGFAEWQAEADRPIARSVSAQDVRDQISRRKFTGKVPTDEDFDNDETERVEHAYNLSHLAVRYLGDTYGAEKVGQFVTAAYNGTYDSLETAMNTFFGIGFDRFQTDWAAWVRKTV